MTKKASTSPMGMEIKKEYLKKHLEEVEDLIGRWIPELNAPLVLAPKGGSWGWQSVYRPLTEESPDNNHMLRRHLRSRALWSNHAHWERGLDRVWDLIYQVRSQAILLHTNKSSTGKSQYQDDYIDTAVWVAFNEVCGKEPGLVYRSGDDNRGVFYGAYRIERSASDPTERIRIEDEHRQLVTVIAELKATKELKGNCFDLVRLQEHMQTIVGRLLKSRDILYQCRFCKHLWK